jgi:hypothetical protein
MKPPEYKYSNINFLKAAAKKKFHSKACGSAMRSGKCPLDMYQYTGRTLNRET